MDSIYALLCGGSTGPTDQEISVGKLHRKQVIAQWIDATALGSGTLFSG